MDTGFAFKKLFLSEVDRLNVGMVNCHAHLDRAFTITPDIWKQASALMEQKWVLLRDIKKKHTPESLVERISAGLDMLIKQGVTACRTHVDADSIVGMMCVEAADRVRENYKGKFVFQFAPQPLEGFLNVDATGMDKGKMDLYEKACSICDVVGGLPSRDRALENGDRKHADFLMSVAKNLGKDLDVHIDQENNPYEKDTEWFLDMIAEKGMQGRATLLHCISVGAQAEEDRKRIYKKLVDTGTNVTVCPWAAIGMKQHKDKIAPLHNSIAPVEEMVEAGVNVSIGTDNISDIVVPEDRGDMFEEIILLASSVRLYDIEKLAKIATVNGHKTLKLTT
ncbi:MAG: amidohydrolase family protein [Patescibacteria group bacterium]|nr:amidohydrolase family protein [Patescibacteria group bacterium]